MDDRPSFTASTWTIRHHSPQDNSICTDGQANHPNSQPGSRPLNMEGHSAIGTVAQSIVDRKSMGAVVWELVEGIVKWEYSVDRDWDTVEIHSIGKV